MDRTLRSRGWGLAGLVLALVAASAIGPLVWGQLREAGGIVASPKPVTVPITPFRLVDTRPAPEDPKGGPDEPFGAGETRTYQAAGVETVPAYAVGVVLNVTTVGATAGSYITVFPAGVDRPNASTLNPAPGLVSVNGATVALGGGRFSVFNLAGSVHVIVDVVAYQVDHDHDSLYLSRNANIVLTQSGLDWDQYSGDPMAVNTVITRTFATASGHMVLPINGPQALGGTAYRLANVEWCLYSISGGSKIDFVEVWADPPASSIVTDTTDRTAPGCYSLVVPATSVGAAYSMWLLASGGGSFGLATIRTTWVPTGAAADIVGASPGIGDVSGVNG